MKLGLYSMSYQDCPVEVRERVSLGIEDRQHLLRQMRTEDRIAEAVALQTCNRLEFYVYAKKNFDVKGFLGGLIGERDPGMAVLWQRNSRYLSGREAVCHLFEVAAGLDSQMIGENQILSQVKAAYAESCDYRMSRFVFHRLFHIAFRVGKAVRTDTDINCGAVSIALAAVELAKSKINLSGATAMVIGAGENAALVARYLIKSGLCGLIVANRNLHRAGLLVSRLQKGEAIGLADIADRLSRVDLIVGSTASSCPVVTSDSVGGILTHRRRPLLMLDIAVPRDIDPEVGRFRCVQLYNIDDLGEQIIVNSAKRHREIPKAQRIVEGFTDQFMKWYDSLDIIPVIRRLTQEGMDLARREADRYVKDFGGDCDDKLKLFAESLVKKMLHGPISLLKTAGDDDLDTEQLQMVDLINKMFFPRGKRG